MFKISFSQIQQINAKYVINDIKDVGFASTERIHPIIYVVITNKYATYKEIRDDYSVEEFLDLYELCIINLYNKTIMEEEAKNGLNVQRNSFRN